MTDGDSASNALYDLIRKELNSIIVENEAEVKKSNPSSSINLKNKGDAKVSLKNSIEKSSEECNIPNNVTTVTSPLETSTENLPTILSSNIMPPKSDNAVIDTDLQNMRHDLQQSYELFQKMGEKFQAINFSSLKTRIKEINLSKKDPNVKLDQVIKNVVQQHYDDNTLNKLTVEMGAKFNQHPGEFGNIPELSEFFRTCTQLQHGLEKLKRQRNSIDELSKRLSTAAEVSYARVNEIQNTMRSQNLSYSKELEE